jgi:hypothetical protein
MVASASRIVATYLKRAATLPLPATFPPSEIGLMTRDEFLKFRNPKGKYHPSDSYETNLNRMNIELTHQGVIDRKIQIWKMLGESTATGRLLTKDNKNNVVAVLHDGTLYHDPRWKPKLPLGYMDPYQQDNRWVGLPVTKVQPVKYITEYIGLVSRVVERNLQNYPHMVQNTIIKGEPFQVRSKKIPALDEGETLVILNSKGEIVADAADEWGATLFRVVSEYRGKSLGQVLGRFWYNLNPTYESGGFTSSGEKNATRLWEERVREFIARGWYSTLVKEGRLNRSQVSQILAGMTGHRQKPDLPEIESKATTKTDLRYLIDPGSSFIVYDARALDGNENDYPDEKYLHAYGFFRSAERIGTFLFRIEYDRPYQKLATMIALQMAKNMGEPLYIGENYTDIVEWENIPGVEKNGDYITLTRDVLPIISMARIEVLKRKPVDRYGQRENLLIEAAEMKWA